MIILISSLLLVQSPTKALEYDQDINIVFPAGELPHSPNEIPDDKFFGNFNNCSCHESPDVLVVCFGIECRDFPVLPISVPLFKLKLSSVTTIRKNDFRFLNDIEALEIEGNNLLSTIEQGCFRNMSKLRNMTISNNFMLHSLEENLFEGLNSLEILSLSKNGFRRVADATRALLTKYLPNLRELDLSQNIFHSIDEHEFYYMNNTGLGKLNLYLCDLLYIHPNSLQPFKNLKYLRIGQNLFNKTTITKLVIKIVEDGIPLELLNLIASGFRRTLPQELLEAVGKSNITDIVLAKNHFDQIEVDSFPYMPNIDTLDLRECFIESISNDAFKNFPNIGCLLINRNRLITVLKAVLVPTLNQLDLSGNSYDRTDFSIPERIFENMSHLGSLELSYNNIQFISRQTFIGLSNLTILNLKNTQLSYIENGAFIHTPKLFLLNLMKNPLLSLMPMTAETFRGLSSVNVTLLGSCGIKNLTATPGLFHYFKNLTFLALDNNEIQTIASNQFKHLDKLEKIHLENNRLTPWYKPILPTSNIEELFMYQNKFTYLSKAMLQDITLAKFFYLDGNPFVCDCSLYPIVQWLTYNQNNYTNSNFIAKCDTPDNWRKKSMITYLNYLNEHPEICETILVSHQIIFITIFITLLFLLAVIFYIFRWYIRYWIFLSRLSFLKHNFWSAHKKPNEIFNYEYDAFISYSIEDRAWVKQLCDKLEPELHLCVFERDFPVGATISHAVLNAVTSSRRTILIVSEAFAKSSWCRWETQLAQFNQIFFRQDTIDGPDDTLLLLKLQSVKKYATPILKYLLKTRIYLSWPEDTENQQNFWNKLKMTLSTPKGEVNNLVILNK